MKEYGYLLVYGEKLYVSVSVCDEGDKIITPLKFNKNETFLEFESCLLECEAYESGEFDTLKLGNAVILTAPHFFDYAQILLSREKKKNEQMDILLLKIAERFGYSLSGLTFKQFCKVYKEVNYATKRKYNYFKYFSDEYFLELKASLRKKLLPVLENSINNLTIISS